MRTFTLFYSWQSDRPSDLCRNFLAEALKLAVQKIRETREVIVVIDADTQGVSGTPPLSETILRKIDACDGFLADLTLVAATETGKASPNPNVLIEYGYALKAKGSPHIILAMNIAFGGPDKLPFDLRHLRHPLQYEAAETLPAGERRKLRGLFAEKLVTALNGVIDQPPARKKAGGKAQDLEVLTAKRLAALQASRGWPGTRAATQQPRLVLDLIPFAAQAEQRLDLRTVKAARRWFGPEDDAEATTSTSQDQWLSHQPEPPNHSYPQARWWTRLTAPGLLERVISVSRPGPRRADVTMDGRACDQEIFSAIRRSGELLAAIGLRGPALLGLSIEGGEVLRLLADGGQGPELGKSPVAFQNIRIDNPADPLPEELRPLLDDLWQAFGWEDGTPSIDSLGWVNAPREPED